MKILFMSDLHLRNDRPICRLDDDWLDFTVKVLSSVKNIAEREQVDRIHVTGDIFHKAKSPSRIVNLFLRFVSGVNIPVAIMPGQHDLPLHNHDLIEESSYGVLEIIAKQKWTNLELLGNVVPFGKEEVTNMTDEYPILHMHRFVVQSSQDIPPNSDAINALTIHNDYPTYRHIVIGDNHHGFHHRNIIVPGCLTVQAADLRDYDPKVWIIDTLEGTVAHREVYNNKTVIVDNYLTKSKELHNELNTFVEALKEQKDSTLSFEDNVRTQLRSNEISKEVELVIQNILENA